MTNRAYNIDGWFVSARVAREFLIRTDGPYCHWCGDDLTLDTSTLDHLITKSAGGSNRIANLVLSCSPCNGERGNMTVEEWLIVLEHRNIRRCIGVDAAE